MNREVHVRICERLGVKFPGPTRQTPNTFFEIVGPVPSSADIGQSVGQLGYSA